MKTDTDYEWIDGCFRVEQKQYGTWSSYDTENKGLITSLNKENCISATRFYLKGIQDGWSS
jgi:hypothetical protein